jgi:hypothetical protein
VTLALLLAAGVLAYTVAKALLVDEIKGILADRRDEQVKQAIASLSKEDHALFGEDWEAGYAERRHRPLMAWRAAREIRISAKRLQADVVPERTLRERLGDLASATRPALSTAVHRQRAAQRWRITVVRAGANLAAIATGVGFYVMLHGSGVTSALVAAPGAALLTLMHFKMAYAARPYETGLVGMAAELFFSVLNAIMAALVLTPRTLADRLSAYSIAHHGHPPTHLIERLQMLNEWAAHDSRVRVFQVGMLLTSVLLAWMLVAEARFSLLRLRA